MKLPKQPFSFFGFRGMIPPGNAILGEGRIINAQLQISSFLFTDYYENCTFLQEFFTFLHNEGYIFYIYIFTRIVHNERYKNFLHFIYRTYRECNKGKFYAFGKLCKIVIIFVGDLCM